MDFRTRLREQIEFSGLLDKEVASKAKISKRAIDSYVGIQGCIPSADVAVRIAKVLNTTVEYLITGNNPINTVTNEKKINIIISKLLKFSAKDLDAVQHIVDALNEKY